MTHFQKYAIHQTEEKWQKDWQQAGAFTVKNDLDQKAPNMYVLEMFPYPSGRLHMGHARNYTLGDVIARYYWAKGFQVLHPMGWDACGLPAENAALKKGVHPADWTYENIAVMKQQLKSLGCSHDWSREIVTCDPAYYVHEQRMFLDFYQQDLVYRKAAYVNWDPVEQTVLANEQVVEGKGWRSGVEVERRLLDQWFFKITDFAQDLLEGLEHLTQWPEHVRLMQENWIGRSQGAIIHFRICGHEISFDVFSTLPETLFGASFCALAVDHPLAKSWAAERPEIEAFIKEENIGGVSQRILDTQPKRGIFSGYYAQHPFLPQHKIPIYIANWVLSSYGTGAVFGCPAHDIRDREFAAAYGLPVFPVVKPFQQDEQSDVVLGDGIMVNSEFLNGLVRDKARCRVIQELEARGSGKHKIMYRLKDWGVGRQRYWGVPIPIIYCPSCGTVPVPKQDLPVELPKDVVFDGRGNPLQNHLTWKHVNCPLCHGKAERETDTFDTFVESSWYFGRFCDSHNEDRAFSKNWVQRWMPVQHYIGGVEHAVMHLLYARFFSRALAKCGYWEITEPFKRLFTQGMVCHKTYKTLDNQWVYPEDVYEEDGCFKYNGQKVVVGRSEKMSKSKCNVVDVSAMVKVYGADTLRLFLLSDTPPEKDLEWSEEGIEGCWRCVNRFWVLIQNKIALLTKGSVPSQIEDDLPPSVLDFKRKVHRTIQEVESAIESYQLNKYVAYLRGLANEIEDFIPQSQSDLSVLNEACQVFVRLLGPAVPHLAQELWSFWQDKSQDDKKQEKCFIHQVPWPEYDESLLHKTTATLAVQVNGKMRGTITLPVGSDESVIRKALESDEKIMKHLAGKELKKIIIIPDKVVSVVLGG